MILHTYPYSPDIYLTAQLVTYDDEEVSSWFVMQITFHVLRYRRLSINHLRLINSIRIMNQVLS